MRGAGVPVPGGNFSSAVSGIGVCLKSISSILVRMPSGVVTYNPLSPASILYPPSMIFDAVMIAPPPPEPPKLVAATVSAFMVLVVTLLAWMSFG